VLAAREALLLSRGDGDAVDDQRGGRIVEDRIESEDLHAQTLLREALLGKPRLRSDEQQPGKRRY
jgi:hypothetical protein